MVGKDIQSNVAMHYIWNEETGEVLESPCSDVGMGESEAPDMAETYLLEPIATSDVEIVNSYAPDGTGNNSVPVKPKVNVEQSLRITLLIPKWI